MPKILDPGSRKELTAELSTIRFLAKSKIIFRFQFRAMRIFTFVTLNDRIPVLKIFRRDIFNDFNFFAIFIHFSNLVDSMLTPSSDWFASFNNVSGSLVQDLLKFVQWGDELNMRNSQININQEKWLWWVYDVKSKRSQLLSRRWDPNQTRIFGPENWHERLGNSKTLRIAQYKRFLNRWVLRILWTHDSFFDDFERLFQAESDFFKTSIFEILNHFSAILFENRFFLFFIQIWSIWICSSWRSSNSLTNINAKLCWNIGWIFMRYKDLKIFDLPKDSKVSRRK